MAERIYTVGHNGITRLVKATTRQQALSHVANTTFQIRVASQDDLGKYLTQGATVENYRNPDQAELDI
jgi:hypothetical protein